MRVLTLDIGGTKTAAAVVTLGAPDSSKASAGDRVVVPTPATEGTAAVLDAAVAAGRAALSTSPVELAIDAVGVSSAGVIDVEQGVVTHATDLIRGWAGTRLADHLAAAFGAPTRCLNDVHAHALGEARHGAGQGHGSMLMVAVGTGLGGAHVVDRHVVHGARGAAGHLGHVGSPDAAGMPCSCGGVGHLEAVASGSGCFAAYRALGGREVTAAGFAAAGLADDADGDIARDVLRVSARATGRALGEWLAVLDPEVVVLSGGLVEAVGWCEAVADHAVRAALPVVADTPILRATTGALAPHLGAAEFVKEGQTR